MSTSPAPITESVTDQSGLPTLAWTLFFNQNFEGDAGNEWVPSFQNLGQSGAPEITGRYYQISQHLVYFRITIDPATNTSAVAGSTYCDNFPLLFASDGFNTVITGTAGGGIGVNNSATNRIYVPAWTNVTTPVTVLGICEAR